jgi:hypothetical protein
MPEEENEEDVLDILHTLCYISVSNVPMICDSKTLCCLLLFTNNILHSKQSTPFVEHLLQFVQPLRVIPSTTWRPCAVTPFKGKLDNAGRLMASYKATAKCRQLIFRPRSPNGVRYDTAKPKPNRRRSTYRLPLSVLSMICF